MSSNQQQGQAGQFAQQGQYGGVTGGGFGGALAKDRDGNQAQSQEDERSPYEGYGANDSSASGGFGLNQSGSSFSRANQMGFDDTKGNIGSEQYNYTSNDGGMKTGASTPGYRKEGEDEGTSQFRGQNLALSKKDDDEPEI
ncbi:hypothetical protein CspHIS471_0604340 [Cutaneotrichosporon sp. HIS471]|nr:hypothetical protein CspHIS471_0604340 [Cutaneotrichosporon sp. HIS471]